MTIDEIRELIQVVTETGVAELEVQRGEDRVRILRNPPATSQQHIVVPAVTAPTVTPVMMPNPGTMAASPAPAAAPEPAPVEEEDSSLVMVKAPIVGTFYEAPSPGAPPFVQVGDTVNSGQVLCIIESMKLMNEIESDVSGVVVKKLVSNSQAVEYGEALFAIRPA